MRGVRIFVLIGLGVVLAGAAPLLIPSGFGWSPMKLAGDLTVPPAATTIQAIAARCHWRFHYRVGSAGGFDVDPGEASCRPGACKAAFDTGRAVFLPVAKVMHVEVTSEPGIDARPLVMPSLGVRVDAEAGRVRETWVKADREGVYLGDLAACGDGQLAMPVVFRAVAASAYRDWFARRSVGN